jgi:CheY-like chemotaxis protein
MTDTALILVVDDDEMNRELMLTVLKRAGYRTLEAVNGRQALALASSEMPALILLDVRMPDMTGYDVCRRLKADGATQPMLVIILSAYENDVERQNALDAGADEFIPKMRGWQHIVERIKTLLADG